MKEKNELKEITGDTLVWQIIKEQKPKKYKLSELIAELKKPSADAEIRKNESKSFDTKTPKFKNGSCTGLLKTKIYQDGLINIKKSK